MVTISEEIGTPVSDWKVYNKAGGNFAEKAVVYSYDSRYLLSFAQNSVRVFNSMSGETIGFLSEHTDTVTSIIVNPQNTLQVYTASKDGTIKLWDYLDCVMLESYNFSKDDEPEYQIHDFIQSKEPNTFFANCQDKGTGSWCIIKATLNSIEDEVIFEKNIIYQHDLINLEFHVNIPETYFALRVPKKVIIYDIENPANFTTIHYGKITITKFHPIEKIFAIGDISGQIILYYFDLNSEIQKQQIYHWHSQRVSSLNFSNDGNYMYSGGTESVFVVWQLNVHGSKQYFPRLGGDILGITVAPNSKSYAIACSDNSIKILNPLNGRIFRVIRGLSNEKGQNRKMQPIPIWAPLCIEPLHNNLVLNGHPGSVQIFDPWNDKVVEEITVAERVVTGKSEPLKPTIVEHIAFSSQSTFMATVERYSVNDKMILNYTYLKFWCTDVDTSQYVIHSVILNPHKAKVSSICFSPEKNLLCTTSHDCSFKLWNLVQREKNNQEETNEFPQIWKCKSVGVYRNFISNHASFSNDGSLLAVTAGDRVVLWDPYSNQIKTSLSDQSTSHLQFCSFIAKSQYLVTTSSDQLTVWDLLTCKIVWSWKVNVHRITVDKNQSRFLIAVKHSNSMKLLLFNAPDPKPVNFWSFNQYDCHIIFLPNIYEGTHIGILDINLELTILKEKYGKNKTIKKQQNNRTKKENNISPFEQVFGNISFEKNINSQEETNNTIHDGKKQDNSYFIDLFSPPSHILPNLSSLYFQFMDGLLIRDNTKIREKGKNKQNKFIYDTYYPGKLSKDISNKEVMEEAEEEKK